MTSAKRPIFNLELDLLRTFVAVVDGNTFAAAAESVCRTQSAVSQQMQRLESLIGKELFARQGRNKTLTEAGTQLLNYARRILRLNDEACLSLMHEEIDGILKLVPLMIRQTRFYQTFSHVFQVHIHALLWKSLLNVVRF